MDFHVGGITCGAASPALQFPHCQPASNRAQHEPAEMRLHDAQCSHPDRARDKVPVCRLTCLFDCATALKHMAGLP